MNDPSGHGFCLLQLSGGGYERPSPDTAQRSGFAALLRRRLGEQAL